MFFNGFLLSKKGPLALIWQTGHSKSTKLTKKKVMEADIDIICNDLQTHISKFALPVRISLVLGATIILRRKTTYLLHDVEELKKRVHLGLRNRGKPDIDLHNKNQPVEKVKKMINLQIPVVGLNLDDPVFEFQFDPFLEADLEFDLVAHMRNVAREEDITMPGARLIGFDKDQDKLPGEDEQPEPLITDGFGHIPMVFDETAHLLVDELTWLDKTVEPERGRIHDAPHPEEAPVPTVATVHELPVGNVRTVPNVPAALPRIRRVGKRRRLAVDEFTTIPREEFKAGLELKTIGTHADREIMLINPGAIKRKNREKQWSSTGDLAHCFGGKRMKTILEQQYKEAVREAAESDEDDEPFGWCGGAPKSPDQHQSPKESLRHSNVADRLGSPVPLLQVSGPVLPGNADIPMEGFENPFVEIPTITDQMFNDGSRLDRRSSVALEAVGTKHYSDVERITLPPPKRIRELKPEEESERYHMAGDFLDKRFQKLENDFDQKITFKRLVDGNSRKKAARCFFFLLKKASEGVVKLAQEEPYGMITVEKVSSLPLAELNYSTRG